MHGRIWECLLSLDLRTGFKRNRDVAGTSAGALFSNPCFTQIHPTCIPVSGDYQSKLTLMSESLRNDGRCWVPKTSGDKRSASQIPEGERDYFWRDCIRAMEIWRLGTLRRERLRGCATKVGEWGLQDWGVSRFCRSDRAIGESTVRERYANLFSMYHEITGRVRMSPR